MAKITRYHGLGHLKRQAAMYDESQTQYPSIGEYRSLLSRLTLQEEPLPLKDMRLHYPLLPSTRNRIDMKKAFIMLALNKYSVNINDYKKPDANTRERNQGKRDIDSLLELRNQGMNNADIARKWGVTRQSVADKFRRYVANKTQREQDNKNNA